MSNWEIKSKKVDAKVFKFVSAFKPEISKLTTYDQAWDIIVENSNITCSIYTHDTRTEHTTDLKLIYKDKEEVIHEWNVPNEEVWYHEQGDWDWTYIFKTFLEYIIKNKLIKKPRKKRVNNSVKIKEVDNCKVDKKNTVKSHKNNVKSKTLQTH